MTAKAIVDLDPGWLRDQLVDSLARAGVSCLSGEQGSDQALALFRAAGTHRPSSEQPTEVHLWTGRRLERALNPFERPDVHHIVGAGQALDPGTIHSLVEHLEGRDWIHLE